MQCTHHLTLVEPTRLVWLVDGAREFEDDSMRRELSWTEDDLDRSDIGCDSDTVVISIESHLSTHISHQPKRQKKKEKSKTFFVAHFRFFQMRRQREEWFHLCDFMLYCYSFLQSFPPSFLASASSFDDIQCLVTTKMMMMRCERRGEGRRRKEEFFLDQTSRAKLQLLFFLYFVYDVSPLFGLEHSSSLRDIVYGWKFARTCNSAQPSESHLGNFFEFYDDASTRIRLGFSFFFLSPPSHQPSWCHRRRSYENKFSTEKLHPTRLQLATFLCREGKYFYKNSQPAKTRESCEQLKNRTQDENISFFFKNKISFAYDIHRQRVSVWRWRWNQHGSNIIWSEIEKR